MCGAPQRGFSRLSVERDFGWGRHVSEECFEGRSAISPSRRSGGRHGRPVATEALPGLFHLCSSGFIPGCRIIGVSLDDLDPDGFRGIARKALDQFSSRKVDEADWAAFSATLNYVPLSAGAGALKAAVEAAELSLV